MSYLETPRIVIAGRFISDVSTINNQDANFDVATKPSVLGWNPRGSAAFDFYDCRVTGAEGDKRAPSTEDPVSKLVVSGSSDRSSAKMVDLDPDWQMSSELWGLSVRLFDPKTQEFALEGKFDVAAFRDLFTRQLLETLAGNVPNGQPSGGRYISVLTEVKWGPISEHSALLQQLKNVTEDDELSIALNLFGYYYTESDPRHTTGTVVGCIGPRKKREPRTFVAGRRLQPLTLPTQPRPSTLIGPADVQVDPSGSASIDLGHALLISDTDGTITDISQIGTALAGMTALVLAVPEGARTTGDRLEAKQMTVLGDIDYLSAGWYHRTGGITSFLLSPQSTQQALTNPIALMARMNDGTYIVLNRETRDGLYVRADNFVQRLDSGDSAEVRLVAFRFGQLAPNIVVNIALSPSGNNTPSGALSFVSKVTTDADGRGVLKIKASDPGSPRPGIDGQIYALSYSPRTAPDGKPDYAESGLSPMFDVIVAHVRSLFATPERPEWFHDVYPIMAIYAQLYPIMSRHLFDLGDYDSMVKHRKLLLLAFGRPIQDSNYMPVTRDLSENKRKMLVKWLESETGDPAEPLIKGTPALSSAPLLPSRLSPMARQARALQEDDIKRAMALVFARDTGDVLSTSPTPGGER